MNVPGHHLTAASWAPAHKTQLRLSQTPDPGKLWDRKWCFKSQNLQWSDPPTIENGCLPFLSSFGNFRSPFSSELWGPFLQGASPGLPVYCPGSFVLPPSTAITGGIAVISFLTCTSPTQWTTVNTEAQGGEDNLCLMTKIHRDIQGKMTYVNHNANLNLNRFTNTGCSLNQYIVTWP